MKVLVYIETKEGAPVPGSLELLTAAKELGETVAVAVEDKAAAEKAAAYGAKVTVLKTGEASEDAQTAALESYIREVQPELVLFSGTQLGKDLAPRLAQRFDAGCVTDVTVIDKTDSGLEFVRPAYGGTILERLFVSGPIRFATVRSGSFEKPEAAEGSVEEKDMPFAEDILKAKVLDAAKEITEAIDLEGADVIVTGGRGMGDAEGFKLVEELAALLGGVVGASRPAIEAGWASRAHQVGQSGKIVAPRLYIACGVSGAMQHVSGIMGSKYIVAINKDEAASIFDIADVGIVGDVKEIIPLLIEEIKNRK